MDLYTNPTILIDVRLMTPRPLFFKAKQGLLAILLFSTPLFGQSEKTVSPSPKLPINSNNHVLQSAQKSVGQPAASSINQQQLERLIQATEKLLAHLQTEENNLYRRVNYFEKPERLDPNSYASKEEVAQWQGLLQQLKQKHDFVAQLYTSFNKDLDTELKRTSANEQLTNRFKQTILEGFPWDTIEKKKQLIADYIDEHGKLLTFYDKNWGSWKTGTKAGKPEFNSPTATNIYNKLRDQIVNTGNEIEQQYKTMSE